MMIIGLTGGIGSGKSTVADLFAQLGIPIIDTDIIAREIVEIGKPAYLAIIDKFGAEILTSSKELDRAALKQRIVNDDHQRTILEDILHPLIFESVETQLQKLNTNYCMVVIPLLVEKSSYTNILDRVLVIDTPESEQIRRVSRRDNMDKSTIEKLISIQATRNKRLAAADDVIKNDKGLDELKTATLQMHDKYMNLCNKG